MDTSHQGLLILLAVCTVGAGCSTSNDPSGPAETANPGTLAAPSATSKGLPPTTREGSAIVRAPQNDVLFVADEDHSALRVVPLPLVESAKVTTITMPGRPAQVLALGDRVLVTVRDMGEGGGALMILKREGRENLNEVARVALPADAWGMALGPDESFVVVTSAWTRQVSVVDLKTSKVRATVEVGREPRGVTVLPDGKRAYISHLVGSAITRIDGVDGTTPKATRLDFPAAPMRTERGTKFRASLGYTVVASPDGERLYFPRHALGAVGRDAWFGTAAVDVWLPKTDAPLMPVRQTTLPKDFKYPQFLMAQPWEGTGLVEKGERAFVQPRAAVYRSSTQTLLVASEGLDALVELNAMMTDPVLGEVHVTTLGEEVHKYFTVATKGGAPSGIALSQAEDMAFVYCRSTDDVAAVPLVPMDGTYRSAPVTFVRLGSDVVEESYALGRALFYNARDGEVSGGLACAGCHPEGRDDGHVWHEMHFTLGPDPFANFFGSIENAVKLKEIEDSWYGEFWRPRPVTIEGDPEKPTGVGYPRQTPMLAGRVGAGGPYGWHSENKDLASRIVEGFGLHRWNKGPNVTQSSQARALHLVKFLREGLVAPTKVNRALTEEEQRGKKVFESAATQCTTCHVPASGFTDRAAVPLPQPPTGAGFVEEENKAFKTPSLLYVGGTPPYFHDGRFDTLQKLVEQNGDKMGKTTQLSADEKKALVAYLETL